MLRQRVIVAILAVALVVVLLGFGGWRLQSPTTTEPSAVFIPVGAVVIKDRGELCAHVSFEGAEGYDGCIDVDTLPDVSFRNYTNKTFIIATGADAVVTVTDPANRVLATSAHFVVAQIDRDATFDDLQIYVEKAGVAKRCRFVAITLSLSCR